MITRPLLAVLVFSCAMAAGAAARAQSAPPAPSQWAFIIGAGTAKAQNATATALIKRFGYQGRHVKELYGPDATQKAIREHFSTLARSLRPADSLLLYVLLPSTERKGSHYLIPADGNESEIWTLLGQDEFGAMLAESRPRAALMVANHCGETLGFQSPVAQQAQGPRLAGLGVAALFFCERAGTRDAGMSRFADAFAAMLLNLDVPRLDDVEMAVRLRRSMPDVAINLLRGGTYSDGFALVPARGRTDSLVAQIRGARTPDEQVGAIGPLVTLARSTNDAALQREVIQALGECGRNETWTLPPRLRAIGALGEIGSPIAVPELTGIAGAATAPAESRRAAVDALARIGTRETLAPLTQALADGSALVRAAAVRAVGGHASLDNAAPLVARVSDDDADVRVAALQVLALLSTPRPGGPNLIAPIRANARTAVAATLKHPAAAVRREAVNTLAKLGVDLARNQDVLQLLRGDEDESVRAAVALMIGREYRDRPGTGPQTPAFGDLMTLAVGVSTPISVRAAAIWSLGEIRDSRSTRVLMTTLRDGDPRIQIAAAEALGKLRNRDAVPTLITLLTHEQPAVRIASANALGAIGDTRAAAPLLKLVPDEKAPYAREAMQRALARLPAEGMQEIADALRSKSPGIRLAALARLPSHPDAAAAAQYAIEALGDEDPDVRQAALALVTKQPAWFGSLIAALDSSDTATRFNAAAALGQVATADAGKALAARSSREQTPFVKAQIASALGAVDPEPAIEARLLEAAIDPDATIRAAAAASLGRYKSSRAQETLRALAEQDDEPAVREAAIRSLRTLYQ